MPKAKHEQLEGGWTRVSGRSSKPVFEISGLAAPAKDATLEKLLADFEKKIRVWQRSSCRKTIFKMLERERPEEGWNLNKAVCLASGSFSRDNFENSKRTMTQFATFIDIVQHVSEDQSNSIQMFAQDPSYTSLDKEFLSHLNVQVLDTSFQEVFLTSRENFGPAQDHLGPQTMLFEFFMEASPEKVKAILEADLRFYMGSSWQTWLAKNGAGGAPRDRTIDSIEEHIERRRDLHFPLFEENPLVFEGLMFHWKETDDEDENGD